MATNRPVVHRPGYMSMESCGGVILSGENRRTAGKIQGGHNLETIGRQCGDHRIIDSGSDVYDDNIGNESLKMYIP
jgi:hypothetical protein